MRTAPLIAGLALVALVGLASCRSDDQTAQTVGSDAAGSSHASSTSHVATLNLPAGSAIDVTLATPLTSETAAVGNVWSGQTTNALMVDGRNIIPQGSPISGTVTSVTPARKGDRAMLDLGLSSVTVDGRNYVVHGGMESVIAGSTRARNLGAIGAATAAGAVIGHAIGGSGKGTLIGAVVGGGAATGVVAETKGYQVVLKQGTSLTFTTTQSVAVRS
jgi:hypothetical protein